MHHEVHLLCMKGAPLTQNFHIKLCKVNGCESHRLLSMNQSQQFLTFTKWYTASLDIFHLYEYFWLYFYSELTSCILPFTHSRRATSQGLTVNLPATLSIPLTQERTNIFTHLSPLLVRLGANCLDLFSFLSITLILSGREELAYFSKASTKYLYGTA